MWNKVFLILIALQSIEASKYLEPVKKPSMFLRPLKYIIEKYHDKFWENKHYSTVILFHKYPNHNHAIEDEVDNILTTIGAKIPIKVKGFSKDISTKTETRNLNIVFCQSVYAYNDFYAMILAKQFNPHSLFILVVTFDTTKYDYLFRMFDLFWKLSVSFIDILTISPDNPNDILAYTYAPFVGSCNNITIGTLNSYFAIHDKWISDDFFLPITKKIHGCPVRVATFDYPPYIMVKNDSNGKLTVDGIEGNILNTLSQMRDFTTEIILADKKWGEVYDNGTTTGIIELVVNRKADIAIGYLAISHERESLMTSGCVYYSSNLMWTIPPGEKFSPLQILMKPFQSPVWICFFTVLVLAFVIIGILNFFPTKFRHFVYGRNVRTPGLNVVNITFGGSLHRIPSRNFARTIFILFTFYCFVINNSYKGSLFLFMQGDYTNPPVSSTDELIKKDFQFYMIPEAKGFANDLHILKRTVYIKSQKDILELYGNLSDSKFKGAMMNTEEKWAHKNIESSPNNYYHRTKDVIYQQNLAIYRNKVSLFRWDFDNVVTRMLESGLINKWSKRFTDSDNLKKRDEQRKLPLNFEHFKGVFQLLGVGFLISFIVFIAEIFLHKLKSR
ncbi:CLUMA_CG010954, isoform A [Clunio marinus]|uniref:CLUMA_CG010954, isoform A n=1 Tax=Clunio marinus TaxID=568069 RepID=A0A1J1IBF6_9DIPT|nr:CLUMA_CG010954, isoform A [Clunio marinus]